ncbi:MAG: AraC family transcriptional regulator [Gemmatimonadetes bacterium]|nr:AraC family transcriptional regulator [Gemmatimonadota bacterium]
MIDETTFLTPGCTVAAGYLDGVVRHAAQRGADRAALLRAIGVDARDVADPLARLPLSALARAFEAGATLVHDAAFALHFGRAVACDQLTLASPMAASGNAQAAPSAPVTVRDALDGLNRYVALGVDFGAQAPSPRFAFAPQPGGAVHLVDHRPGAPWPALTESTFARMAFGLRTRFGQAVVRAVHVRHAAPPHAAAYADVFGVPVHFGAPHDALELDGAVQHATVAPASRVVAAVLRPVADQQLAALRAHATWRGRVEAELRRQLADDAVDMQRTCRSLAVSRQTLFRRLRDEGTSYAALLAEVRRREAEALLAAGTHSVGDIARRLGFSETAAFSRAFSRWTGRSPSARRSPDRLAIRGRHHRLADRAAVAAEPDGVGAPVVDHVSHGVGLRGTEVLLAEERAGLRIEADESIGLAPGLDHPQAVVLVDGHGVGE